MLLKSFFKKSCKMKHHSSQRMILENWKRPLIEMPKNVFFALLGHIWSNVFMLRPLSFQKSRNWPILFLKVGYIKKKLTSLAPKSRSLDPWDNLEKNLKINPEKVTITPLIAKSRKGHKLWLFRKSRKGHNYPLSLWPIPPPKKSQLATLAPYNLPNEW